MRLVVALILATLICDHAWSYTLKCDSDQKQCHTKTRRLVRGDNVGIFDDDGYLVAIGRVIKANGLIRQIKIFKKYGTIPAQHDAQLIKDHQVKKPEKFFKVLPPVAFDSLALAIGVFGVGVGSGLSAKGIDGYYERKFYQNFSWLVRIGYLSGSGNASETGDELLTSSIDISALSVLGGATALLLPYSSISIRTEISMGLVNMAIASNSPFEESELVEGRIFSGNGFGLNVAGSVLFRLGDTQPFVGGRVYKMQNSLVTGIEAGLRF